METPELIIAVAILTCLAIFAAGGAIMMFLAARREAEVARTRAVQDQIMRSDAPAGGRALALDTVKRIGETVTAGKVSRSLRATLTSAGLHSRSAPAVYLGIKFVLLSIGLAGFGLLAFSLSSPLAMKVLTLVGGAGVLFFLPNLFIILRRARRTAEIRDKLPDAIDLLEISVSSGMGMDTAWNAVSEEIRRVSPALSDEMELTTLEVGLGVDRSVAMKHMSDRTDVDDISSLVALLIQAEEFGSSISEALRVFATTLRQIQSARAEESAEKMAVKMLFPMVLFIFPSLLVVMAGPAMVLLVENIL